MKTIWSPIEFVEPYSFEQAMEILNDAKRLAQRFFPTMEEQEAEEQEIKFMFNAVEACANKHMWSDIANVDFVFHPRFIKGTFVTPTNRDDFW
jgi:hypothetical protein